jgi:multicomponent Na+:H+ antiporter subunit B
VVALAVVRTRDLFSAAMLFSIYSLLSAALFVVLDAGDVALTEAAVGAGISTILILAVLTLAPRYEVAARGVNWTAIAVVVVTGGCLLWAVSDLPTFGDPNNPIHVHVAPYYIEHAYKDFGVPNMVAAILASWRSIDTFGEVIVIFTAAVAVFSLLSVKPVASAGRPEDEE